MSKQRHPGVGGMGGIPEGQGAPEARLPEAGRQEGRQVGPFWVFFEKGHSRHFILGSL